MKNLLLIGFCCVAFFSGAETSRVWEKYSEDWKEGKPSVIPDYSYAGYKYGTEAIPDVSWKVFDVTKYGAKPNDGKPDNAGIQRAIKAAESNGSGVIFFPKGKFLVSEKEGIKQGIEITGANIVLRGSGSGSDGTEIHQQWHYDPSDPEKMWTVPPVFLFQHPTSKVFLSRNRDQARKLSTVVKLATRETFFVEVKSTKRFKRGQTVMLCMNNKAANKYYLKRLQPREIYTDILENGVSVSEKHTVAGIKGNRLIFEEPLHTDINPAHGWTVYDYPTVEGWGVEDLHFTGNCPVPFVHHKNYIHDSGFRGVHMRQGKNGWIRRCRFTDMSQAFAGEGCLASSFIMNTVDGHQGHDCFDVKWGGGCLIGLSQDLTDKGSFHGCGISHENVGAVVWRYESVGETKQTPRCGGPDFHAQYPYCSLWDSCTANIMNNGGNYRLQPNHLRDLTFWNFEQIGLPVKDYDYWDMPETELDKKNKYYGPVKLVYPNYIGFHGVESTFYRPHLGLAESHGTAVEPASLYVAQLTLRLGNEPEWIEAAKEEWQAVKAMHRAALKR